MSLERLTNIHVILAEIRKSNVMDTLKMLKATYERSTDVGSSVRRLILKFNNILTLENRTDVEIVYVTIMETEVFEEGNEASFPEQTTTRCPEQNVTGFIDITAMIENAEIEPIIGTVDLTTG